MPLVRFFDMTSLSFSQNEVTLRSNLMPRILIQIILVI